jgi:hypothetical protein
MKKVFSTCLIFVMFVSMAFAQKSKPWTEWSKKDVEKMLNDSGWGQTQTTGESEPVNTTVITATTAGTPLQRSGESGEPKVSKAINYRARFLTAKPIRKAFARMVLLSQQNPSKELSEQLQAFIDRDFGNFLVVAVNVDSQDSRAMNAALQAFNKLTVDALKEKAYLERKDGKRLLLADYKAPVADGMGGKFVFSRTLDGLPFLTEESEYVRFVVELNDKLKLNIKFKVSNMIYDGKLEY